MGKENWPRPTIDQAMNAGMAVAHHYGVSFSKIDTDIIDIGEPVEPEYLTNGEAEQRLLNLADRIMDGTVTSHVEIARVVRTLGHLKLGPMGSASTEIDLAAFRVHHAILQKQGTFITPITPPS